MLQDNMKTNKEVKQNRHIGASDTEVIKMNFKITIILLFMLKDLKDKNERISENQK